MPVLKTYGLLSTMRPEVRVLVGDEDHHVQARYVVAAPSKAAALRAFEAARVSYAAASEYRHSGSGSESGNPGEVAVTQAEPGVVFVRSINRRGGPIHRVPVRGE